MKESLRIFIYAISIILFSLNYQICEYFYPYDIDNWWMLKVNINAIVMSLVFIASSIGKKGILRFVLEIGAGLTIANMIDRFYSDTTQFTRADIIMIIVTFLFAIIDYKKDELRENN